MTRTSATGIPINDSFFMIADSPARITLIGENRKANGISIFDHLQEDSVAIPNFGYDSHHSEWLEQVEFLYSTAKKDTIVRWFVSTQNLEIIRAIIAVGAVNLDVLTLHYEVAQHRKTGVLVGIRRDLETLDYGIAHDSEVRGGK